MSPALRIDVHFAARRPWVPSGRALRSWAMSTLACEAGAGHLERCAVSIVVVGGRRSRALNARFRGKDRPTNVLSFEGAGETPDGEHWLGEILICAPVVAREARMQGKSLPAHWAHMTAHGVLHLLGFDHQSPRAARTMESIETQIVESMGFPDPYRRF